jgi:hypothetical protein
MTREQQVADLATRLLTTVVDEHQIDIDVFVIACLDAACRVIKAGAGVDNVAALDSLIHTLVGMRATAVTVRRTRGSA